MKYLAIILLASYTCSVIGKPVGEQQPAETTNPSAPTVITDYSSVAKAEEPKDAAKSEAAAVAPAPAAAAAPAPEKPAEQIPTGKDVKEFISETSSNLASVAATESEVKKVAVAEEVSNPDAKKIPQQDSSISSESSSSSEEEHPAKIVETSPTQQEIIKSEETVKAVAEVALAKEEEKKIVPAADAPVAATSEAPKESNSQVNSVSVEEPKPADLKSETALGAEQKQPEKIETPIATAATTETGKSEIPISQTPAQSSPVVSEITEQKKLQSSEETSSEEKVDLTSSEIKSSSEAKSEEKLTEESKPAAAAAPATPEKLPVPEPIKPVEPETPKSEAPKIAEVSKIDSVKSEAPKEPLATEQAKPEAAAPSPAAAPAPAPAAEEVKELPQPLAKPAAEEQKPAAATTEEKKEKLVVKRETQKYEDEKKPTDGFVKKEEYKKIKIDNNKPQKIGTETFAAKSSGLSDELLSSESVSSEELLNSNQKTPQKVETIDAKYSAEEDNKSK